MSDVRLHKVRNGDIFTLTISAFAQASTLWNNPHFFILSVRQIRPRWLVTVFRRHISIPKPYKIWVFKIMYITDITCRGSQ